jgi:hypothetical protein
VGRHVFRTDEISITILWRWSDDELKALMLPPAVIDRWARQAMLPDLATPDTLLLTDEAGTIISGAKPDAGTRLVTRLATETGLPWNVTLKPALAPRDLAALTSRRRQLGAGLGAIVLLISGGGYLLWRTVHREIAVARIQTEFVAAVSHEFRTPLTSLSTSRSCSKRTMTCRQSGDSRYTRRWDGTPSAFVAWSSPCWILPEWKTAGGRTFSSPSIHRCSPATSSENSNATLHPIESSSRGRSRCREPFHAGLTRLPWGMRCGICWTTRSSTRPSRIW